MGVVRAAQYLRMSTEHQRYSIENQIKAIAAFAAQRGFEVVKTYSDEAKSGVSMRGRDGLKALLAEVVSGAADYSEILVYDVSRWGRFQDPDQAGHYEFLCREAGLRVRYCMETFDDDGGMASTIMKHIKRVMAGEFSREMSAKAHAAQILAAKRGLKMGGLAPYGTRRQLVDHDRRPIMVLGPGQRKALSSDRVVFIPGPREELRAVRLIFRWYGLDRITLVEIVRRLKGSKFPLPNGLGWSVKKVQDILKREIYRGIYVFARTRQPFGVRFKNPPEHWIRVRVFAPLVSSRLWQAAQARIVSGRRHHYTDEELLKRLRRLARHGPLSHAKIAATPGCPSVHSLTRRFGSYRRALELIGEAPPKYFSRRDRGQRTSEEFLLAGLRRLLATHGYLSIPLISDDPDLPSSSVFYARFGGMPQAYKLAGWDVPQTERVRLARARGAARRWAAHREAALATGDQARWSQLSKVRDPGDDADASVRA